MMRLPFAVAAMVAFLPACVFAEGETFVGPGATGQIEFPVESDAGSIGNAAAVQILVEAPPFFKVKDTSIRGPVDIQPGQTQTFVIDYEIDSSATEGPFTVVLRATSTIENIAPELSTYDTSVRFRRSAGPFIVGNSA